MKHKKQHYIKILNQDINEHDQHANVPNENSGTLNVQSRYEYPMIDPSNATFPSTQVQVWPSKHPQWSRHFVNPAFYSMRSHSMAKLVFYFILYGV